MRTLRKTRQSFVGSPFMVTERRLTDEHYAIHGGPNLTSRSHTFRLSRQMSRP